MILVVGGIGAGKRNYVKQTYGYGEDDIANATLDARPVLADLHVMLANSHTNGEELLDQLLQKQVVICNEVGCGVVPIEASERKWRDDVGRLCARIAAKADTVVRVTCGLPLVLKGETP